ncbi:MAG: M48 family metalloprotease [Magnetococcus sp. DMHC-8]
MSPGTLRAICLVLTWVAALAAGPTGAEVTSVNDLFALLEKKYGLIDPATDPQVARVRQVFARVQNVADKRGNRMPQLTVVDKPDTPWAIALPDGHILLSSGAIELCYRQVTQAVGDARIAFVLGHELAHLAKNDFWDMEVYLAVAGTGQVAPRLAGEKMTAADRRQRQATAWHKETEADDLGFLYASIAGYPTHLLLARANASHDNFFSLWTDRFRDDALLQDLHPPPADREAFLRARLEQLAEGMPLFRFGLRLAHFGHCDQAVLLFRHFLQIFPAREVYNNLGACHLYRAQRELPATATTASYWLPVLFDATSRADLLLTGQAGHAGEGTRPVPPALPDRTDHALEQAVDYLEQAVEADAAYLPARLNLATAHVYRGELLKARVVLEEALRLVPHNREVVGWHALLLHLDSQGHGLGDAALPSLTRLAAQTDAPASLVFNHALLLKKAGRNARSWWNRLASRPVPLPARYARIACSVAKVACASLQPGTGQAVPWPVPVQPGVDVDAVDRDKLLAGWRASDLGWLPDRQQGTAYRRGETAELLVLDGSVTMVVLRGGTLGTTRVLTKKAGKPTHVRPLAEGEIWGYGTRWAALVRDERVREVWVTRKGL